MHVLARNIVTRKMAPRPIYCTEVAKVLGYDTQKNSRTYFLKKKNQARHKLRQFDVNNPDHMPIIKKLLSVHQTIHCASRVPLEERVCRVIGGFEYELCNNFRHRLDAQTSQRRVEQQQEETSRIATVPVDSQEGVVTATIVAEDESRNNLVTAADTDSTTIATELCDNNSVDLMVSLAPRD